MEKNIITDKAPENCPNGQCLVEVRQQVQLVVIEEQTAAGQKTGKVRVRGEFAKAGIATENKRVYPRTLWEREIDRLNKQLESRQVFGELDHPADGRTSLQRVSHIVTNLTVSEDGIVEGEAEILDTEQGRNLKALLAAGCKVGVSSRGYGTTKKNQKDEDVVQEDYRLVTFDFVAEPADQDALPNAFYEDKRKKMAEKAGLTEAAVESYRAEALEHAKEALKQEFAQALLTQIAAAKDEALEQARQEMLADPALAGAKTALESVRSILLPYILPEESATLLAARDGEITRLKVELGESNLKLANVEGDLKKATDVAREVGYRFYVERQLTGHAQADLIRQAIGDVKQYENAEAIQNKIESIKADLQKQEEAAKRVTAAARVKEEQTRAREQRLSEEKELLEAELEEARYEAERGKVRLYAEQRLTNHPKAASLRKLVETAESTEDVDQIIESVREQTPTLDESEQVRANVRKALRGGRGVTAEHEEQGAHRAKKIEESKDYMGLGISLSDLKTLAGIPAKSK